MTDTERLREERNIDLEQAQIEATLKTKSKYYLEDCIRNNCNSLLAEKILQERQSIK